MRVYLLRHGRTAYNDEQRYQGLRDIPLSQTGEEELRPVEEAPETVYVSPLSRARRTAELLFPHARQVPVEGFRAHFLVVLYGHAWRIGSGIVGIFCLLAGILNLFHNQK